MGQEKEEYLDDYTNRMRSFLKNADSGMNVVLENDFRKFMPLFNREALSHLSNQEIAELSYTYNVTFDATRPIYVISNELDENGVVYAGFEDRPGDGLKHKVLMTFPPSRRRLKTMNEANVSMDTIDKIIGGIKNRNPGNEALRTGMSELTKFAESLDPVSEEEMKRISEMEEALLHPESKEVNRAAPKKAADADPDDIDADWED